LTSIKEWYKIILSNLKNFKNMSKDLSKLITTVKQDAPELLDNLSEEEVLLSILDQFTSRELQRALDCYLADFTGEPLYSMI
jgi:hypothetical protein